MGSMRGVGGKSKIKMQNIFSQNLFIIVTSLPVFHHNAIVLKFPSSIC